MKKVCLITPGHISTNPRLVKEAMALSQNGYQVHIIFTQYVAAQLGYDDELLKNNPEWSYHKLNWVGNTLTSKFNRFVGGLLNKLSINNVVKINRNAFWQQAKAQSVHADLYIAHNLGALPIAVKAAAKNGSKCGFDAEDYHRNETSNDEKNESVLLNKAIEDQYLPKVDHLTASSSFIADRYASLYHKSAATLLNVFPRTDFTFEKQDNQRPLQLFWFSQTIGAGRGLDVVIKAINSSQVPMHLHLLGNPVAGYVDQLKADADSRFCQITLHPVVAPHEVFALAHQFDIGLAAEPGYPLNRDICLTNKLFTYIQAGLAVVASDTTAQKDFISKHPVIGELYTNETDLAACLVSYHNDRDKLLREKRGCLDLGNNDLNWETESKKYINLVKKSISD